MRSPFQRLEQYQCHCSRWTGIGRLAGTGNWVDEALVIKAPWEFHEAMEAAVAEMLPRLPTVV